MTELHRIPKKQLDSGLFSDTDDMLKIADLGHTTAEVKASVDAYEGTSATPEEIDDTVEFVADLDATPSDIDDAVDYAHKIVKWEVVPASVYTATPASISRISMSDTSLLSVGAPIRYTYNSVQYFGVVASITTNTHVDVAGAPLNISHDITELAFGDSSRVVQIDHFVGGTYADGVTDDLLNDDMDTAFSWMGPAAYLVAFKVKNKTNDTTTAPQINVLINGYAVGTENTGNGVDVDTSWNYTTYTAIDASRYYIHKDDAVEIACKVAGGTGDADSLTVECLFVLE